MAIVKYSNGIEYAKGALAKPKKTEGHTHGSYLIGTHREAPTTNPNCTRAYIKEADAYKRSTPVTAQEQVVRARFTAISKLVKARKADLSLVASDLEAFNAQKETGYKTMKQYLWNVCAAQYDQNNG